MRQGRRLTKALGLRTSSALPDDCLVRTKASHANQEPNRHVSNEGRSLVSNEPEIRPIRPQTRIGRSWRLSGIQSQIYPRHRPAKSPRYIPNHTTHTQPPTL